ncbi:MAG TPA: pseudouridine synthase [Syntrophales bacterium]|nr:pseudouridine synthase [Syntrophales bacterium]HQN77782.1 pseudouridine synthase [Syntrophales bacterium]HQQ27849.1 pseudouridine synthase [Syntrophales bacterium]
MTMEERIQKILARAGIASRRKAEALVLEGRVTVNGEPVSRLGSKADPERDEIRLDGRRIQQERTPPTYIALYKPPGYVTTLSDPLGRPTVANLVKGVPGRIFPVGRLDYDSEGLLLMTNDGDFAQRVQHPRYGVSKEYSVKVRGAVTESTLALLRKGARLDDGFFKPLRVSLEKRNPGSTWFRVTIHEGKNRVIRRYFESFGHPVARLIRTAVGGVFLESMKAGEYRYLTKKDLQAFPAPPAAEK